MGKERRGNSKPMRTEMPDKEDLILEEVRYIRGKMDEVSPIVMSDHQRLEDHLQNHRQGPDKVVAATSIISAIVAIIAMMIASNANNDEKKDNNNDMGRNRIEWMHE